MYQKPRCLLKRQRGLFSKKSRRKVVAHYILGLSKVANSSLKRRADRLEEKLRVLHVAACSLSAPLQEKLAALEKLYGQFNVRVLCESLGVARGTLYNHIFRRKAITQYDIRREEIREQVKSVFDESNPCFTYTFSEI